MNLKNFTENNKDKLIKIHWNSTIEKYVNNMLLSKSLLEKLKGREYFSSLIKIIENMNKSIDKYIEDSKSPVYQIAVVGAIKAGKSTLINTLIGHDILSVDVTPETATLTKIKHSKNNSLNIKFYKRDEWDKIWKDANDKNAETFLEEYKLLNANEVKEEYLGKSELNLSYFSFEELKEDIEKWTSSKRKEHYFVKEIEIGLTDLELDEQIALVDTPGLNDTIEYRSNITKEYIDSANAVIVCVNAKTLRSEEYNTITKVFSRAKYRKNKIYVVGTQLDILNSKEDWEKQKEEWIKYLKSDSCFGNETKAREGLIGVSAYAYSIANKITNKISHKDIYQLVKTGFLTGDEYEELLEHSDDIGRIEKTKNNIISSSNIKLLNLIIKEKLLEDFNTEISKSFIERYKILKNEINNFRLEHQKILEEKRSAIEKDSLELERKLEEEENKIKEFEEITKKLANKVKETNEKFNLDLEGMMKGFKKLEEGIENINI